MDSRISLIKALENEFSEFLIKRIAYAGGSIQLQHITGHLSQVRPEVRDAIVNSKSELLKFLKKHDNLFVIKNNEVSLAPSSSVSTSGYESDNNSTKSLSNLPSKIQNGKGVIVKICPGYGFIKSKEPIKIDVFFNSKCFGDKDIDLTGFLHIGAIVFFHARRELKQSNSKYRAVKVWRIHKDDDESNVIIQKSRKTRETGLYDPLNLESDGIIQNIFPNLGFISVKGDDKNTVFFHKNRVVNYDNIVDLTKVFSKGDTVEFSAHRSSKPDAKARWEATKVWKTSGKVPETISQSDDIPLSLPKQPVSGLKAKIPEMIKDQRGKIYPRSNGAVIKFGNNFLELADGDSALYYVCGTQVTEIGWEFSEGDDIYFDAVKIKSAPGWKAVLVWTDGRPNVVLPTCLGDYSEFMEDDDNGEISSSIYTSKSSLCMSESSSSSVKSERLSSKSKNSKKEKSQKLSGSFASKETEETNKLSKYRNASFSRDSLNSLPASDDCNFVGKKTNNTKKLSKNYNASSRDSLNSLPVSDIYAYGGKKIIGTNKKLSKNYDASSRGSLNSLPVSDKYCLSSKNDNDTDKKLSKNYEVSRGNSSFLASSGNDCNLKSSEKKVRSTSANKSVNQLNKMVSNSGESADLAGKASESMVPSKSFKSDMFKYASDIKNLSDFTSSNKNYNVKISEESIKSASTNMSVEQLNKMVLNSAETADIVDEAYESMEPSKNFRSGAFLKCDSDTKNLTEDEMSSEYASAEEGRFDSSKCVASIKRFRASKGNISKVFTRVAQVKSKVLQNAPSFTLNDFYLKGMTMDELNVDDLKTLLKVGDNIYFNGFEIIDDSGQVWDKITVAWIDFKPRHTEEMSPEDFIVQNGLSVTVNNEMNDDEEAENDNPRKFLTSFVDEDPDDNIDNLSKTESCSEDEEESLTSSLKSQTYSKAELPVDSENLLDAVNSILMRNVFPKDSMTDITSISEEIIGIIQHNYTKKVNVCMCNVIPGARCSKEPLENVCSKNKETNSSRSNSFVKTNSASTQTIITGDIISQNILADW